MVEAQTFNHEPITINFPHCTSVLHGDILRQKNLPTL